MPTSALSDVIRYYRDCFQASFFSSAGYGLFDHKDITPLCIDHLDATLEWSEQWQQQYVIDADQVNLMRIDGIVLVPEPNSAATTDAHYRPARVGLMNKWADDPEAVPDWDEEWQTQLQADSQPADRVTPGQLPSPGALAQWLQTQAKTCTRRTFLPIQILLLVPKNYRAAAYKADFLAHLDHLSEQHHQPDSLLWQCLLKQMPQSTTEAAKLSWPFLSDHQNQALHSIRNDRFSLIQGPPGTGKSRLLATLAAQLAGEGRSVLLTSHSDHALTVLRDKLVQDVGIDSRWVVHLGPGRRTRKLSEQLSGLLTSQAKELSKPIQSIREAQARYDRVHRRLKRQLKREPDIDQDWLLNRTKSLQRWKQRWWSLWHREHRHLNRKIEQLHQSIEDLYQAFSEHINGELQQHFHRSKTEDSTAWSELVQNLKRKSLRQSVGEINRTRQDLFTPTQGLKLWLIKLDDLPEQAFGLFDTVVIDEATQVNMAEAIPALAMSRRAVIAGDPRQLRHYSFLSHRQEARIAESLNLTPDTVVSFRDTSLLDYSEQYLTGISAFSSCHLLNEHYRSAPPLMDFNSREFYQGHVQVLTGIQQVNAQKLHLNWVQCFGQRIDKVNKAEAASIIERLQHVITREQGRPGNQKTTLGVLSFFRDQAEYLKQEILQSCSLNDIRAHRVKVGTPFSFQGEERDHMLISCAIDDDSHAGTWGYLNQPDVFNVATSRARRRQTLFLSATPASLPVTSVLRHYYDFTRAPKQSTDDRQNRPSWLQQLMDTLHQTDFRSLTQQHIADIPIDLILESDEHTLAVDLIGFPTDIGQAIHLQRYQALFRAGIPLFPLTAREWLLSPERVIDDLQRWAKQFDHRLSAQTEPFEKKLSDFIPARLWQGLSRCESSPEVENEFGLETQSMIDQIQHLETLLTSLFQPGSISFLRYQSAITSVAEQMLENLETFRLLFNQVWEQGSHDHDYWNALIAPIRQRHVEYQSALGRLQTSLQETIAKQQPEAFHLDDLEALTERLKHYR